MKTVFLAAAALLLGIPAFAGEVSVHLALEPNHVLAGIRPSFHITVQNETANDVQLPPKMLLLVTPSDGASFIAQFGGSQEAPYSRAELPAPRTVKPHDHAEFRYVARTLDGPPGWFDDARLNGPGSYRLQLLLADGVVDSKIGPTPAFKIDTVVAVRFRSDEAVLAIETPHGDDAALYCHLVNLAHARAATNWTSNLAYGPEWLQFMKDAVEKYPSSPYAPFVVRAYSERLGGERLTPEERLANAKRVLDAQPNAPNRDDIRLFMAEMEVTSAQHAAAAPKPDMTRAIALYDRARAHFEEVERTAADPEIRQRSREQREALPSRDDLRQTEPPAD